MKVPDTSTFDFINQFLASSNDWPFDIQTDANERIFETNYSALASMLERAREERVFVLPFRSGGLDAWVITGSNKRALFKANRRIANFIVPSYARFYPNEDLPTHSQFDPKQSSLSEVGSRLYPAGYFSLRSPRATFSKIFSALEIWSNLDEQRPTVVSTFKPRYREMLERFESYLASHNWREAQSCLQEIRHNNLTTTENLSFLEIYLLSKQSRWDNIWESANYENLAKMKVPRNVRAALLSSFYYCVLAQYEESAQLKEPLDKFKEYKPRLGLLLTGRFQINESSVLKVFCYLAVLEKDLESLSEIRRINVDDSVEELIRQLEPLIPFESDNQVVDQDFLSQAKIALAYSNYDRAFEVAELVQAMLPRTMLKMEIAFMSGDPRQAEDALLSFWNLSPSDQQNLIENDQRTTILVDYLSTLCEIHEGGGKVYQNANVSIQGWTDWFDVALQRPDDPRLQSTLRTLEAVSDDRQWDKETISRLSDQVLNLRLGANGGIDQNVVKAILYLTNQLLLESEFPRSDNEFVDFYEVLLVVGSEIFERTISNSRQLLRLAEAFLSAKPSSVVDVWNIFSVWYSIVIPALEEELLNTYDAVCEYGLEPSLLKFHFRTWLEQILASPRYKDEIMMRAWRQFCEWLEPGEDLIEIINENLVKLEADPAENIIRSVQDGYRIGIFTLNGQSAMRARDQLLDINPGLDIRICTSKVLSDEAKSIASNSDVAVIVTTCLSHSLTNGIRPFLNSTPIYPPSSGSVGIVRAIMQFLSERKIPQMSL